MHTLHTLAVFTVGYQECASPRRNFNFDRFVSILHEHAIDRVGDIRRHNNANDYPKNPWCESNLAPWLLERCIQYSELKAVAPSAKLLLKEKYGVSGECDCGSQRRCSKKRVHPRQPFTIDDFRREYLGELRVGGGVEALRDFLREHASERVALLCWEADPNQCHRRMLLDKLLKEHPGEFSTLDINESVRLTRSSSGQNTRTPLRVKA